MGRFRRNVTLGIHRRLKLERGIETLPVEVAAVGPLQGASSATLALTA